MTAGCLWSVFGAARMLPLLGLVEGDLPMSDDQQVAEQERIKLMPDFLGESRHEFIAKLAFQNWQKRGMPFGSPEIDWFAAEQAFYEALVTSGLALRSGSSQDMEQALYR
jgi:hypothetical protein